MAFVVVLHHSPSASVQAMTDAVVAGCGDPTNAGVDVVVRAAYEAGADDVRGAAGVVLGTSVHFGYMSGALKHFFDTSFLASAGALGDNGSPAGAAPSRLPFGLYVHGRYDTEGAVRSVLSIVGALGWRQSAEILSVLGDVTAPDLEAAYDLGGTITALAAQ